MEGKTMKTSDLKPMLGKFITYKMPSGDGIGYIRYGWVDEVQGRNVDINGDWIWGPDIIKASIVDPQPEPS